MGAQIPAARLRLVFRWVLPWATLLLLLGSPLLVTHGWSSQEVKDSDEQRDIEHHFPATVEYALHIFNIQSKDSMAYRLVRILKSWREQNVVSSTLRNCPYNGVSAESNQEGYFYMGCIKIKDILTFSMEMKLRRTECGKFDEDIDNCPFQESPELNNTITCFFTISTEPWRTKFELLNKTCLEDFL